jgi:hypothetical protein
MEIRPGTLCVAMSMEKCVFVIKKIQKKEGVWFETKLGNNSPKFIFEEKDLIPLVENCERYKTVFSAIENNLPQILAIIIARFENKINYLMQTKINK